jgi:hypothetical protein
MLEFLQFIFQSFWHFLGFAVLLVIVGDVIKSIFTRESKEIDMNNEMK